MLNKEEACKKIVKAMAQNKKIKMRGTGKQKLIIKKFYDFTDPVAQLSDGNVVAVTPDRLQDIMEQIKED